MIHIIKIVTQRSRNVYYFMAALTGLLQRSPELRPEYWVWLPPLAFAVAGVWLFRRVDRA